MSRAYHVRGLSAFARDMRSNWKKPSDKRKSARRRGIGFAHHGACSEGLECQSSSRQHDRSENPVRLCRPTRRRSRSDLGIEPVDYADIKAWNAEELARERVRLWYVATTRARDLLVLPRHSFALKSGAYANIVDFDLPSLEKIDPVTLGSPMPIPPAPPENEQTRDRFVEEAREIARSQRTIEWRQPSRSEEAQSVDAESVRLFRNAELAEEAVEQPAATVAGSATRGTILHKLMEEVLNGETDDVIDTLVARALKLMAELSISPSDHAGDGISPDELARTVVRTLSIPEIARLKARLVPEYAINGSRMDAGREIIVSGIADAIAYDNEGRIETIVDWKSDVAIDAEKLNSYYEQLDVYQRQTGARNAVLVLMTPGKIVAI